MRESHNMEKRVLIVCENNCERKALAKALSQLGHNTIDCHSNLNAIHSNAAFNYDIAFIDLPSIQSDEIESIETILQTAPDTEIIALTHHDYFTRPQNGNGNYILANPDSPINILYKPFNIPKLARVTQKALERRRLIHDNTILLQNLNSLIEKQKQTMAFPLTKEKSGCDTESVFIGESKAIKTIKNNIAYIASINANILIRGETGTGKDVVVHFIHQISKPYRKGAFVKINCPSIPESLFEAELFGHEPGAFTGADRRKLGLFEQANQGTIFLDEIAEVPSTIQAKLLQFLEQKKFFRVGGNKMIRVDARIVSATNAPLENLIEKRLFRADVYYRLNEYTIELPPLRERLEDIPYLLDTNS